MTYSINENTATVLSTPKLQFTSLHPAELLSSERYPVTDEISPFSEGLASSGPSGFDGYFGYPAFSLDQATTGAATPPGREPHAVMTATSTHAERNAVNPPATFTNDFGGIKREPHHSVSAGMGEFLKDELTAIAACLQSTVD
jgi:hypothetical protein